jgi:hypothetical protein
MILLWKQATARTRIFVALNIIAVIAGGLSIDAAFKWPGQIIAVIWTFFVWGWLYKIAGLEERRVMILATAICAAGTCVTDDVGIACVSLCEYARRVDNRRTRERMGRVCVGGGL